MKQRIPNSKILCCASIFALSLAACSNQPKVKPDVNLTDKDNGTSNHIVKLKKGHRSKKLGLPLPDPRSYDNLWDRLFDRFDLPAVSHQDVDRELNWFINHPAYIERVQSRAEPFLYSIVKQLEKHNMPGELALLPVIESAFQPHVVSPAHAAGIWQFIPATGRHYGLKQSRSYDGRRDIYASTRAAIKYLKKLHNDFNGDWLLAIAGYNCGEGAVARAIQRNLNRGLPTDFWSLDLPQETRSYVPRLLAVARLFSESDQYGFALRPIPNKALYKTVKLNSQVDLALAANAAEISLDRLFELNPGFKRQHVDLDGSYRLFIPAHKKIVDFKEELARQMASVQAGESNAVGSLAEQPDLKLAVNPASESLSTASISEEPKIVETLVQPSEASKITQPPFDGPITPQPPVSTQSLADSATAMEPIAKPAVPAPEEQSFQPVAMTPQVSEPSTSNIDQVEPVPAIQIGMSKPSSEPVKEDIAAESNAGFSYAQGVEPTEIEETARKPLKTSRQASQTQRSGIQPSNTTSMSAVYEKTVGEASNSTRLSQKASFSKLTAKAQEDLAIAERAGRAAVAREDSFSNGQSPSFSPKSKNIKDRLKERESMSSERHHPDEPDNTSKMAAYRVQEGDTLYSIARKHDLDVEELKKMNHLSRADDINYGQTLVVPGREPAKKTVAPPGKPSSGRESLKPVPQAATKYTAHDGETLFSISRRFNVTVADLRKWNGIKEDKQFRAGMNITVSGGEKD